MKNLSLRIKIIGSTAVFGLAALVLLGAGPSAWALHSNITYDPWADSVHSFSGTGVNNPENAVGEPDGSTTNEAGLQKFITLDMGLGEEGTENLRVHFGQLQLNSGVTVTFLDAGLQEIKSETRSLGITLATSSQEFNYDFDNFEKAYRYVRVTTTADAGFTLDAVEALGYIGRTSSVDTDGDGVADRTEQHAGTNPQVPDQPGQPTPTPTPTPSPTQPPAGSPGPAGPQGPAGPPGPTGSPAAPLPASSDRDRDGMDDSWEITYNFNPNSSADANQDADGDGLTNVQEYHFGTNPRNADTDGDGMPDKWEVDNDLNPNFDDADQDPDGDGFTNLEEYLNGTDPHVANVGACKFNKWYWWLIFLLLLVIAFWLGRSSGRLKVVAVK